MNTGSGGGKKMLNGAHLSECLGAIDFCALLIYKVRCMSATSETNFNVVTANLSKH